MIEKKEVKNMDMYQKRKIRAEKKNNDSQKSFSKVPISWETVTLNCYTYSGAKLALNIWIKHNIPKEFQI